MGGTGKRLSKDKRSVDLCEGQSNRVRLTWTATYVTKSDGLAGGGWIFLQHALKNVVTGFDNVLFQSMLCG